MNRNSIYARKYFIEISYDFTHGNYMLRHDSSAFHEYKIES